MSQGPRQPSSRALVALVLLLTACSAPASPGAHSPEPSAEPALTVTPTPTVPPPSATPRQTPTGGVYLAIGDSLTFGIGVPRPAESGFVARVADALADGDPPIAETRIMAVPGETATGFLDRHLDDVLAVIETLGQRVELVTIGLGANEVLRVRRESPCVEAREGQACRDLAVAAIAQASGALDVIVDQVRDALATHGSRARILVLAYYNPELEPLAAETIAGTDGAVSCDPAEERPGLNDRIACVVDGRSATLVDLHAAFLGREAQLTHIEEGDIHPNDAGYQVIAETILEAVRSP